MNITLIILAFLAASYDEDYVNNDKNEPKNEDVNENENENENEDYSIGGSSAIAK
jgi:hypothetical protein